MADPKLNLLAITCTSCGAENSLSEALSAGLLDDMVEDAKNLANEDFESRLLKEREKFEHDVRRASQELASKQLTEITKELADMNSAKMLLEIDKAKTEAANNSLMQTMEAQIELAATAAVEKERASFAISGREKQEEINRLQKSIAELKSTSNTGSSQLIGESGELFIEDRLKALFPLDFIDEIKKGQNGADCLWTIRSNGGSQIGKISFESKVTQKFQAGWLTKLKDDMVERGAAVGIVVTKTMPNDCDVCHFREGVWVCGFHEFETLAKALRQAQIELTRTITQNVAKDDKATELFDFVVGREFSGIMEKILRPIFEQHQMLEKEKRSLTRIWKAREKYIQKSVEGASLMAGQLEAILGAAVVNKIGFENFEVLEIIEDEGSINDE